MKIYKKSLFIGSEKFYLFFWKQLKINIYTYCEIKKISLQYTHTYIFAHILKLKKIGFNELNTMYIHIHINMWVFYVVLAQFEKRFCECEGKLRIYNNSIFQEILPKEHTWPQNLLSFTCFNDYTKKTKLKKIYKKKIITKKTELKNISKNIIKKKYKKIL